ncbi:MAG: GNAT family N-acetyltransferase [Candidatus Thorarchaeota archaeon]|nr:MAG: hypothetical protein DRP09_08050 [Candidatus Thorarchaeota archaeon]RLI58846.1 MAG: hypothetical protein DRO87_04630 [Candidatus Thorarchaeota archaeon]
MMSHVETLNESNVEDVLAILARDPLANIILIADCTQLRNWCDVQVLRVGDQIWAVFALYSDLDFLATAFWAMDTECLKEIVEPFRDRLQSHRFVAICTEEQLEQIRTISSDVDPIEERQMFAGRDTELRCECKSVPVRMTRTHAQQLKELYRMCGTPAWTPSALDLGPSYGILTDDDRVVSVAGVHFVTPHGAEIGNVATHPEHRRKGYAEACIKAVVQDVLTDSDCAILHYFADNKAAQKLYERMGFEYSHVNPLYFVKARLQ